MVTSFWRVGYGNGGGGLIYSREIGQTLSQSGDQGQCQVIKHVDSM